MGVVAGLIANTLSNSKAYRISEQGNLPGEHGLVTQ